MVSPAEGICSIAVFLSLWAAGHMDCVEILTAHGGNLNLNIRHLGTPLYVACKKQQVACARKLLESGKPKKQAKRGKQMKKQ